MSQQIKLGPLALLLTVISICLTVLSILTFTTARADKRLAEKYANTVEARYTLEAEGQRWLRDWYNGDASAESDDPSDTTLSPTFRHTISQEGLTLSIALKEDGQGGYTVTEWKITHEWTPDTDIGNLWGGNAP